MEKQALCNPSSMQSNMLQQSFANTPSLLASTCLLMGSGIRVPPGTLNLQHLSSELEAHFELTLGNVPTAQLNVSPS